MTLIVGDGPEGKESSSNGVGKTLALGLVHHCLGSNSDKLLRSVVPDWWFTLYFCVNGVGHRVDRNGDGRKILLDGKSVNVTGYRDWLNQCGAFYLDPDVPSISFRSLLKRFARYSRGDCLFPTKTERESEYDARLRTLYLLGVDCSLVWSKRKTKLELDSIAKSLKNWREDDFLKSMFRAGSRPKFRHEWLEREIDKLKEDLRDFRVSENYRSIELEAGELTKRLRDIDGELAVKAFHIDSIEKSLRKHPDISKQDLMDLYEGLKHVFKPEALEHFEAVEEFHNSLSMNRRSRLENDKRKLEFQKRDLEQERNDVASARDRKVQSLQGKRALDEYAAISSKVASLEEERDRIYEYLNYSESLQEKAQKIRELRVEEDREARNYLFNYPLQKMDEQFAEMAEAMYPSAPAGIEIDNNTGDNQIRFDVAVQIEGDDSDGINAARIIGFDVLNLMSGSNHSMSFAWHDNRLFADMDPKPRAAWFKYVMSRFSGSGKQYIASLNTENFEAMRRFMSEDEWDEIKSCISLVLRGDREDSKLLGIQFGKSSLGVQ
ncbi:DUF2326 domain-containing protein [Halomonas aestuarii]|uniref:DUF2326 domain-containing protein n=1 Tax=Halomonas aestuarii TaxID=1897729 RepID=UPI001AD84C36|nr:DUF2326 domain-containing protein [Halomonas aestuarii]